MPSPRPHILHEATYRQLLGSRPNVAVLPWGATEAHGWHLPHGTDVIEATAIAEAAVEQAVAEGAKAILLPAIPFGNNAQQQDQIATIHFSTSTALAILRDVAGSLVRQGIDRLVIVNGHGGNAFAPLVRDVMLETGATILVVNFWQVAPEACRAIFADPGDHAGELETSLVLHLRGALVEMDRAGDGRRVPFEIAKISQPGVWTPRPWSHSHPDTGCGDPRQATTEKGEAFFLAVCDALAEVLVNFSAAHKGQSPYLGPRSEAI
ncbi:MAG: creatininase family protein [Pirellulales bacterium]